MWYGWLLAEIIMELSSPKNHFCNSWWRHQMETFSALLALCAGNSPVTGEFPPQRPVTRKFDAHFWSAPWMNSWVNNREAGDLRRHRAHYSDVRAVPCDVRAVHWLKVVGLYTITSEMDFLWHFWRHMATKILVNNSSGNGLLPAPNLYLNQYWLLISEVLWH